MSSHQLLAGLTKTPELAIEPAEAEALAASIVRVAECYPGLSGAVSGETMAWIALIQTLAMVYGPRVPAILARRKREAPVEQQPAPFQPGFTMGEAA